MRVLSALDGFRLHRDEMQGGIYAVDVRAKLLISILASLATVMISSPEGQLVLVAVSFIYALGMRRPGILVWAYLFVAVIGLLAMGCTWLIHLILPQVASGTGFASLTVPFLRLLTMVHVLLPLVLSCRIQNVLNTLRDIGLPFCLYLPAAVMIRFIPTFLHDIRQVAESLKLRGYRLSVWSGLRHPVLTLRLLFIPLLFRSLHTSEDLGIAAELKGLGYGQRMIPYHRSVWAGRDSLFVLAAVSTLIVAGVFQYVMGDASVGGMHR